MTTPRVYVSCSPDLLPRAEALFERLLPYGVSACFNDPRGAVASVWLVERPPSVPPPPSVVALSEAGLPSITVVLDSAAAPPAEAYLGAQHVDFLTFFAAFFFQAAGLARAPRVVLQAGFHVDAFATLPSDLAGSPCLALPPSAGHHPWDELRRALQWMRRALPAAQEVVLAGSPSRGLGALVGATWARASGVSLDVLDAPRRPRYAPSKVPMLDQHASIIASFSPQDATALRLVERPPSSATLGGLTLAFLPTGAGNQQAKQWCYAQNSALAMFELAVEPPPGSRSIDALLATCEGALRWARRTFDPDSIDVLFGLPASLATLLLHELSDIDDLRFWDPGPGAFAPTQVFAGPLSRS